VTVDASFIDLQFMFPQIIAIKEKQKNVAVLFWQFLFYQVPSSLVFIDAHV